MLSSVYDYAMFDGIIISCPFIGGMHEQLTTKGSLPNGGDYRMTINLSSMLRICVYDRLQIIAHSASPTVGRKNLHKEGLVFQWRRKRAQCRTSC
jgi:hypothetical protein